MMIGANDVCGEMCFRQSPWSILEDHKRNLMQVFRIIRDNLPRTLFSIVNVPYLKVLVEAEGRTFLEHITVDFECPCLFGLAYQKNLTMYYEIMRRCLLLLLYFIIFNIFLTFMESRKTQILRILKKIRT